MPIETPYDDEEDTVYLPRRAGLPTSVMLLGEAGDGRLVPLQVDGDDRLVLGVATLKYIPRTVQLVSNSKAEIEDTPGYLFQVNAVNVSAGGVTLSLYYSDANPAPDTSIVYQGSVPARSNLKIELMFEIGSKTLWALAGAANSIYLLCSLHKGQDYVRP